MSLTMEDLFLKDKLIQGVSMNTLSFIFMIIFIFFIVCFIIVVWDYLRNNPKNLIRKSSICKEEVNFILQSFQLTHLLITETSEECYSYRRSRNTYISPAFEIEVPVQSFPPSRVSIYCKSCGHDVCVTTHSYVRTRRSFFVFFTIPIFLATIGGYLTFSLACWPGILVGATLGIVIAYPVVSKIWGIGSNQFDADGEEHAVIIPEK